ncbi:MAG TPA: hypothetical protein VF581_07890 [Flavobacterium sp.]|jgi:hypothetical protein
MQLITITIDELTAKIRDAVRTEFEKLQYKAQVTKGKVRLTRKETAYKLKCSITTLWRKRHELKPRKKGGNVYYFECEVDQYQETND